MTQVNVYGTGCKKCVLVAETIATVGQSLDLDVSVSKVTDLQQIMEAGVVNTPAVGIDGKLVHSGSVPTEAQVKSLGPQKRNFLTFSC